MSRHRVVIRSLKDATVGGPRVVIGSNLSKRDAEQMQKRFIRLKWEARRPDIYTIDHIALSIELDS